jgi:hypothetical protein
VMAVGHILLLKLRTPGLYTESAWKNDPGYRNRK